MGIIITLLAGALIGWLASMITGDNAEMGAIANIVIGIAGSILGGFLYTLLFAGDGKFTDMFLKFEIKSLFISVVGAVILLAIIKALR